MKIKTDSILLAVAEVVAEPVGYAERMRWVFDDISKAHSFSKYLHALGWALQTTVVSNDGAVPMVYENVWADNPKARHIYQELAKAVRLMKQKEKNQ